jgi:hypothetical protein
MPIYGYEYVTIGFIRQHTHFRAGELRGVSGEILIEASHSVMLLKNLTCRLSAIKQPLLSMPTFCLSCV